MIVSTKGRYALRVMVCFAQRGGNEDSRARKYKNVKLAVALAVLAAFFWYLFW